MLRLEAVDFAYDGPLVLQGISLEVPRGEWMGLLGPNGSGKSTLLRCISGLLRARRGEIFLEGKPLKRWSLPEIARKVAVVGQEASLEFGYTVRELVSLGRTPYMPAFGWEGPQDREVVRRTLEETGLEPLADRLLSEVSGGERQRAWIAMALAQEPELLLLDEPTSHLDIHHQFEVLELISRLHRDRGMTVLATFHDLTLAALYCERVALLDRGTVAAQGRPSEVLRPEILQKVFGVTAWVGDHPLFPGRPLFAFSAVPDRPPPGPDGSPT